MLYDHVYNLLCLYSRTSFAPEIHSYTPLATTVCDFLSDFPQEKAMCCSVGKLLQKHVHAQFNHQPIYHMISFCNSLPPVPSLEKVGGCFLRLSFTNAGSPFAVWHPDPLAIRQSRANASIGARLDGLAGIRSSVCFKRPSKCILIVSIYISFSCLSCESASLVG